jgi:hypothetical protein
VASSPVDTGDLPGDIGDELQSLALELHDAAQVRQSRDGIHPRYFLSKLSDCTNQDSKIFTKKFRASYHCQMAGRALFAGVPTTGLAADTAPLIA